MQSSKAASVCGRWKSSMASNQSCTIGPVAMPVGSKKQAACAPCGKNSCHVIRPSQLRRCYFIAPGLASERQMVQKIHSIHVGSYFIIKNIENNKTIDFRPYSRRQRLITTKHKKIRIFIFLILRPVTTKRKTLGKFKWRILRLD